MTHAEIKRRAKSPAEAIRWACELEASAPKAGNVHPEKAFDDLSFDDFLFAATVTSKVFADRSLPTSERALKSIQEIRVQRQTNVNLGIVLLLAPLVSADESTKITSFVDWCPAIERNLANLSTQDSRNLFATILAASPGGMGRLETKDIHQDKEHDDIVASMKLAASWDRIAKQYADGFNDLLGNIVPVMQSSLVQIPNTLQAIARAHILLLRDQHDSLIARKCGIEVAAEVRQRAINVDLSNPDSIREFDRFLRSRGNQLNPGTTADLIAASLYVIMRTPNQDSL